MDGPAVSEGAVSLREQQKLFTRRRLLDAAIALFDRNGFANTTAEEITRAAGASRATLYAYFPGGKDEILRELRTEMWAAAAVFYETFGELPSWSRAQIRQWLDEVVAVWEHDARRARILTS